MMSIASSMLIRCRLLTCESRALLHTSCVMDRARKGTRERKRKVALANKKKKEERLRKNPPPIPYKVELMLKSKGLWGPPKPVREKDDQYPIASDNAYFIDDFAWKRWSLEEAVKKLRYLYHPTMLDKPNDLIFAKIDLDLRATKKTKYLEPFSKMAPIIHAYDRNMADRNVLLFVPTEELKKEAMDTGAIAAGGEELISEIMKGRFDVTEVDYFLCHPEMLANLKPLLGTLRDRMPRAQDGTVGENISLMVKTFAKGIQVEVKKVAAGPGIADEPDYGYCLTTIGRLNMDDSHLKDNLDAILETLNENKPKRKDDDTFLTRCQLHMQADQEKWNRFLSFSVRHPLIDDPRAAEQERVRLEEGAKIQHRVQQLRATSLPA